MSVVLIADDDDDIRFALEHVFTRAGFTVLSAADGMAALKIAVRKRPDAIVSDLDMPRLNGLELCEAIRGHAELRDVPVALLSGSMRPDDRRATDARLCGVLVKPVSNRDLVAAVRSLVEAGDHDHRADSSPCPLRV